MRTMPPAPVEPPPSPESRYRRTVFGVVAAACLAGAPFAAASRGWSHMLPAGMIRIGVVCGAAWLAYPELRKLAARRWTFGRFRRLGTLAILAALVLLALRPVVFGPMLAGLLLLTIWRRRQQTDTGPRRPAA